jgi:hypothetical protein
VLDGGNTLISIERRPQVMQDRMTDPLPFCPGHGRPDTEATMYFLCEEGEILSDIEPCHPGPLWGAEGGPVSRCRNVNLSRGNAIRQHGMNTLACKLARLRFPAHPYKTSPELTAGAP